MKDTRKVLLESSKNTGLFQLDDTMSKKLKEVLLEIYKDIFDYCEENHLNVMLGGGSTLGCIRHGGYIPWDDDMDLIMARKDYDLFIKNFEKSRGDKYELFVPDGKHKITNLFLKVSKKGTLEEDIYTAGLSAKPGISIDIFPIENVPANSMICKTKGVFIEILAYLVVSIYMFQNRNQYMKNSYCGTTKGRINYFVRMLLGFVCSFLPYEIWYITFDKLAQNKSDSGMYTIPTGRKHYRGELHERDVYFPPREAVFEGIRAYIPNNVEVYLERLYGDYMKLPEESERERHFYTNIKI